MPHTRIHTYMWHYEKLGHFHHLHGVVIPRRGQCALIKEQLSNHFVTALTEKEVNVRLSSFLK